MNLVTFSIEVLVERFQIMISVIKFFLHHGTSNVYNGQRRSSSLECSLVPACQWAQGRLCICVLPCTENRFSGFNDRDTHTFFGINKAVAATFTHVLGTATASSKGLTCKTNVRNLFMALFISSKQNPTFLGKNWCLYQEKSILVTSNSFICYRLDNRKHSVDLKFSGIFTRLWQTTAHPPLDINQAIVWEPS